MIIPIINGINPVWCNGEDSEKILNEAISFDIEVTSVFILKNGEVMQSNEYSDLWTEALKNCDKPRIKELKDAKKFAFMYGWTFDINDRTILGRTWNEFFSMLSIIKNHFKLSEKRRMCIYVHNLSYEFQFLAPHMKWKNVFATKERKPIYAISESGFEFRCSYKLSGYSLKKIGEQIGIEKSSDLDYNLIRHSKTILKPLEKQYMIIDVKILSAYIRNKIKEENGIVNIPITKTGYVRRLFRARCLHSSSYDEYMKIMKRLKLTLREYNLAKKAFMGGFTHSNKKYFSKRLENVVSYDLTSSYPTVLVSEKYPMGSGQECHFNTEEEIYTNMYSESFLYVFQIELKNVYPIFFAENYISQSKCIVCENAIVNNGRIYSADRIIITITNIDFQIIEKCYKFDIESTSNVFRYHMDYLPVQFIETIFELYKKKTELKDVIGKEAEYLSSKEDINASFGMCVTDIIRDIISFSDVWEMNGKSVNAKEKKHLTEEEKQEQLNHENNKRGRFLFYLWGVFCTAYARRKLGGDYIYSDTDSVKFLEEKHKKFFEKYNGGIDEKD